MVLLEKELTRPAPFADMALLWAHTDTRASCGREKASAQQQQQQQQQRQQQQQSLYKVIKLQRYHK
jgi:hypothetical protein